MTLHRIVAALGGDLYQGGQRANVPAPGHSSHDRSVSLLLSGDRLIIHGFGGADWREVRDHLRRRGLIDAAGQPIGGAHGSAPDGLRPDRTARIAAARRIWEAATSLTAGSLSHRHLLGRGVRLDPAGLGDLRHHPAAPVSVFRPESPKRPAMIARITAPDGSLTAVELVYLEPNGRRAERLRVPRKTIGVVPPGSAVRLATAAETLLVGEGVMTVLSASERFEVPAWALMSARNLAAWSAPPGVRHVVIAADRGAVGEASAQCLMRRLRGDGLSASLVLPPAGTDDWNAAAN
jgi:putative DNA primase/helicase